MTNKQKTASLNEAELNDVQGGGLLLPAVQRVRDAAISDSSKNLGLSTENSDTENSVNSAAIKGKRR